MNKSPLIFIISGKARSGKDVTGDIIVKFLESKKYKVTKLQYAKYIKMYAKDYFGWDGLEETKPRDLLQSLGTDIRNKFNKPLFFTNRMKEDIDILSNYFDAFVITDARIKDELINIKNNYEKVFTIRINSINDNGLTNDQKNNYTEIALNNYTDYDYIIYNNGTIEELKNNITEILNSIGEL